MNEYTFFPEVGNAILILQKFKLVPNCNLWFIVP